MGGRRVARTQELKPSYEECLAEVRNMEGVVGHQEVELQGKASLCPSLLF